MIVCQCRVVSDRDVADAVASGARSVASVCRSTRAAQDCGSCVFSIKALVNQAADQCQLHGALVENAAS